MINLYELANAELEDSRQKEMTEHSKSRDLQHEFGL